MYFYGKLLRRTYEQLFQKIHEITRGSRSYCFRWYSIRWSGIYYYVNWGCVMSREIEKITKVNYLTSVKNPHYESEIALSIVDYGNDWYEIHRMSPPTLMKPQSLFLSKEELLAIEDLIQEIKKSSEPEGEINEHR